MAISACASADMTIPVFFRTATAFTDPGLSIIGVSFKFRVLMAHLLAGRKQKNHFSKFQ
jgi:hypothetical protein